MSSPVTRREAGIAVVIREAQPADAPAIRELHRQAFGGDQEGAIVDALRCNGGVQLSLVATMEGNVLGHIVYSQVLLSGITGAALGPMAVAPQLQRQGIGTRLVEAGNRGLAEQSCPFIVVVGHPEFYRRFGFTPASVRGVTCEWEVPDDVFMIHVLDETRMDHASGVAKYRPEFGSVA
jgi:putative acetyltransferase